MSCPHSTRRDIGPGGCSMCQPGAVPRVIRRDTAGILTIDGKPVDRTFQPAPPSRNGQPKRRHGGRPKKLSPAVRALRLVEPETVDDPE